MHAHGCPLALFVVEMPASAEDGPLPYGRCGLHSACRPPYPPSRSLSAGQSRSTCSGSGGVTSLRSMRPGHTFADSNRRLGMANAQFTWSRPLAYARAGTRTQRRARAHEHKAARAPTSTKTHARTHTHSNKRACTHRHTSVSNALIAQIAAAPLTYTHANLNAPALPLCVSTG